LVRADALGRAVVAESAAAAPLLSSAMRMRMLAICELCAMCCITQPESLVHGSL